MNACCEHLISLDDSATQYDKVIHLRRFPIIVVNFPLVREKVLKELHVLQWSWFPSEATDGKGVDWNSTKSILHFPLRASAANQSLNGTLLFWKEELNLFTYRDGNAMHESVMIQIEGEDLILHLDVDAFEESQPKDLFFRHAIQASPTSTPNKRMLTLWMEEEGVAEEESKISFSAPTGLWRKLAELLGWTPTFEMSEEEKTEVPELACKFVLGLVTRVATPLTL